MKVSGVLLAAGQSLRLGGVKEPKQLLRIGDKTLIEHVVDRLLGASLAELVVVLGFKAKEVAMALSEREDQRLKLATNKEYQRGLGSSISCGVRAVSKASEAILIALADMPFIEPGLVDLLIDQFSARSSKSIILVPVYRGIRGHPVLFAASFRAELLALDGPLGARVIIEKFEADVEEVAVATASIIEDIDDEQSYFKACKRNKALTPLGGVR